MIVMACVKPAEMEYSLPSEEKMIILEDVIAKAKELGITIISGESPAYYWDDFTVLCDSEQMASMMMVKKVIVSDIKEVSFSKDVAKLCKTPEGPCETNFNRKVEVHMPGQALSVYNEVMLLEDSCTDMLQSNLNKGWRIIAACPQPDSRRPDYILGRFNPNHESDDRASRG